MSDEEPKKRSWMKIGCIGVLGLFGAILALGAIGNALMTDEQRAQLAAEREAREAEDAAEKAADAAVQARSEIDSATPVSARDLAAAYEQNEVAAQRYYGERVLLVSGSISSIALDMMDEPVIALDTGNPFQSVQLDFDEGDADAVAALRQGQNVSALCREVSEVIGMPMLDDCTLID